MAALSTRVRPAPYSAPPRIPTPPPFWPPRKDPSPVSEPLLRVTDLCKSFGPTHALRNVSLTLDRGAALGVIGGSGSGKSTLARTIARFEHPDSGDILIDGRAGYTA